MYKRVMVPFLMLTLWLGGPSSAELIGWWTFDDPAHLGADSSGKGNDGTVAGDAAFSSEAFAGAGALWLDGTDDYIDVGLGKDNMLANWTSNLSIAAWIKPDDMQRQWNCFFGHHTENNGVKFELMTGNFRFTTLGVMDYDQPVSLPASEWSHVALTFNQAGNLAIFYANGRSVGQISGGSPATPATGSYSIGYGGYWEPEQFQGLLDEVRIYNHVLTEAEVKQLAFRPKAYAPSPADGATGVMMPLLAWSPGSSAAYGRVYFGTTPDLTEADLVGPQVFYVPFYVTQFPVLQPGTTYYWRIDGVEGDGTTYTGDVWRFTTKPLTAYAPAPADGSEGVFPSTTLSWSAGAGAMKHHLYFSNVFADVDSRAAAADQGETTETTFSPSLLRASTTYHWCVDEVKLGGTVDKGAVWSFTTEDGVESKIVRQWWSGIGGTAITALTGHANYPHNPSGTELMDTFEGPVDWADNYGTRMYGWLIPPESGEYTFWVAGDDATELHLSTDADPANATVVARVTGWTNSREWTKYPEQQSAPIALQAGQKYFIQALSKEGGGGDNLAVSWQGPGVPAQAIISAEYVDAYALPPLQAFSPCPANGQVDTPQALVLSWSAGEKAQKHEVYFGDDEAAVAAADTSSSLFQGSQAGTSYDTGALEWGKTYFWRVDETSAGDPDSPWIGRVWSFTTANFIPVDDFESYNDEEGMGTRIYETWLDGWVDAALGTSTVGNWDPPFAEQAIVHSGKQSMPLDYNNVSAPYYAEAALPLAPQQDWTVNGVSDLTLWIRGNAPKFVENDGVFTLSAQGADLYMETDECRFAYKQLTGNGSITLRLDDAQTVSNWTKTGLMIRSSLAPRAARVHMVAAARQSLVEWMYRVFDNDPGTTQFNTPASSTPLPVWLRITRTGDVFTGEYSADGTTWSKITQTDGTTSSTTVTMPNSVYVGMVVSSVAANVSAVGQFSEVETTGNVSGAWQVADIGVAHGGNDAAALYVTVQDSSNKTATVTHPDPGAVNLTAWTEWKIPLTDLAGVNLSRVKRLHIGVGDRSPGGAGRIYVDDIRVTRPEPEP